jgi:serine/threonine protein phosphatase 1
MHSEARIISYVRTLVIGDIHGNLAALKQVFERSQFDPEKDRLISLGDVFDGHPYSAECVDEFLKVRNLVWCLGNHDTLALSWLSGEWDGRQTLGVWRYEELVTIMFSYGAGKTAAERKRMKKHAGFVREKGVLYHVDKDRRLYVHAGIDWDYPVDRQPDPEVYYYDRKTYALVADQYERGGIQFPYRDVFIGHTKTIREYPDAKPVRRANLWNLDTGAGTYGKLTIMDADTHEYWQSDWSEERG